MCETMELVTTLKLQCFLLSDNKTIKFVVTPIDEYQHRMSIDATLNLFYGWSEFFFDDPKSHSRIRGGSYDREKQTFSVQIIHDIYG